MSQTETTEKPTVTYPCYKSVEKKPSSSSKSPILISISPSTLLLSLLSCSLIYLSLLFLPFKGAAFWFIVSNAIILFIAAIDADAFSLEPDLYNEYARAMRSGRAPSHTYCIAEERSESLAHRREDVNESAGAGGSVVRPSTSEKTPEKKKYRRSQTEKTMVVAGGRKRGKDFCRSATEVVGGQSFQEGESSAFLDVEELNRRVDEFIRKFNREIRLQETKEQIRNL